MHTKKVEKSLAELANASRTGRTIMANDYYIKFLKMFSSATPIMKSRRMYAVGGGYFLSLGGYGCVVDPGHHFLNNFFANNHTLDDIDAVIVTHFHDDHYADLPSLFSLFYRSWKKAVNREETKKIFLFCDKITHERFGNLINASRQYIKTVELRPCTVPIPITEGILLRVIPTSHDVFGERDTGVGLAFDVRDRNCSLVITGDTSWTDGLNSIYDTLRSQLRSNIIMVAHVSSICKDEIPMFSSNTKQFHTNHLCMHGLCRAIEILRPQTVLLSEVGEELESIMGNLEELVKDIYGIKNCKWCGLGEEYPLV